MELKNIYVTEDNIDSLLKDPNVYGVIQLWAGEDPKYYRISKLDPESVLSGKISIIKVVREEES